MEPFLEECPSFQKLPYETQVAINNVGIWGCLKDIRNSLVYSWNVKGTDIDGEYVPPGFLILRLRREWREQEAEIYS